MGLLRILVLGISVSTFVLHAEELEITDLKILLDPEQQEEEVSRIAGCKGDEHMKLARYHVLACPQVDEKKPLYLVASQKDYVFESSSIDQYPRENIEELFEIPTNSRVTGITAPNLQTVVNSSLHIFDNDGQEIRPFGGDNYMGRGYFYDFNRDTVIDRGKSTWHRVDEAEDYSIEVFELKTVEAEPTTLLRVIYNWHHEDADKSNIWTFNCFDEENDGFVEVAFGPKHAQTDEKKHAVVFRWDAKRKAYTAKESHPHVRVLKPSETLKSIALAGGLNYPIIGGDTDDQGEAIENSRPHYTFASLTGMDASTMMQFFQGKSERNEFGDDDDAPENSLPKKFWDTCAKKAALAFADYNRTPEHRKSTQLAVDYRNGVKPPEKGWILYDWGSSSCYSYSSTMVALQYGVPEPVLIVPEYNTIGVVGHNLWADRPAHQLNIFHLTSEDARFIADTVFWLNRIRSYDPNEESTAYSRGFSTADGFGELTFINEANQPQESLSETIWATRSVSNRWRGEYTKGVYLNLVHYLLIDELVARERKKSPDHEIERHSLVTPLADRLSRNLDEKPRRKLATKITQLFAMNELTPLPVPLLSELVNITLDDCLISVLPELISLQIALPEAPADPEYEDLKKLAPVDASNPFSGDPDTITKQLRLYEIEKQREFIAAHALAEPLGSTIYKLRLASDPKALENAIRSDRDNSHWELNQLHRLKPEAWVQILLDQFRSAPTPEHRTQIFRTLSASTPLAANELASSLDKNKRDELILDIAELYLEHFPKQLDALIPTLIKILQDRNNDVSERCHAMGILVKRPQISGDLRSILLEEFTHPQMSEYGSSTLPMTIDSLCSLPNPEQHLDLFSAIRSSSYEDFTSALKAIARIEKSADKRSKRITPLVQHRFNTCNGMVNQLVLICFAFDLRIFEQQLSSIATEAANVPDGELANGYQVNVELDVQSLEKQRYHSAREITAIWNEPSPVTRAKMAICLVAAHPSYFDDNDDDPITDILRERVRMLASELPRIERKAWIEQILEEQAIHEYYTGAESWLRGLAEN